MHDDLLVESPMASSHRYVQTSGPVLSNKEDPLHNTAPWAGQSTGPLSDIGTPRIVEPMAIRGRLSPEWPLLG